MESARTQRLPVLIVGATGKLGSFITKHCLTKPNLLVSVLVRNPDKDPNLRSEIEKSGGKVIKGDLLQPETLVGVTNGIHTVISAVDTHEEKICVQGQTALVNECVKSQVKRFIPSNFGINYTKFSKEEMSQYLPLAYFKVRLGEYLKTLPIKLLSFWPGLFIESFFMLQDKGFHYWGDDHVWTLTTYEDIARVAAEVVQQEDRSGDVIFVGNKVTIQEIGEIYNKVRGTNIAAKRMGNIEEIQTIHKDRKKYEATMKTRIIPPLLFDERSAFLEHDDNSEFPGIKPTSLEEFLRQNPQVTLKEVAE